VTLSRLYVARDAKLTAVSRAPLRMSNTNPVRRNWRALVEVTTPVLTPKPPRSLSDAVLVVLPPVLAGSLTAAVAPLEAGIAVGGAVFFAASYLAPILRRRADRFPLPAPADRPAQSARTDHPSQPGHADQASRSAGGDQVSWSGGAERGPWSGGGDEFSRWGGAERKPRAGGGDEVSRSGDVERASRSGAGEVPRRTQPPPGLGGEHAGHGSSGTKQVSGSGGGDQVSGSGGGDQVSGSGGGDQVSGSGGGDQVSRSGGGGQVSRSGGGDQVSRSGRAGQVSRSGSADRVSRSGLVNRISWFSRSDRARRPGRSDRIPRSGRGELHVLSAAPERAAFQQAVGVADRIAETWPALGALVDPADAEPLLAEALWEIAGVLARRQELTAVLAELSRPDFAAVSAADRTARELRAQAQATRAALTQVEADLARREASLRRAEEAGRHFIREQEMRQAIRAAEDSLRDTLAGLPTTAPDHAADLAEQTQSVLTAYRELTAGLHFDPPGA
jgi:hypothetical protein